MNAIPYLDWQPLNTVKNDNLGGLPTLKVFSGLPPCLLTLSRLHRVGKKILNPIIEKFNGTLHKEMGDGLLFTFQTATDAIKCGIKIQKETKSVKDLNLRIGIHIGDVIEEGDDIFGDGVNIASRIQGMADSGGICISQAVYDSIQSQADIFAQSIGKHTLKGIDAKQELYTLKLFALTK